MINRKLSKEEVDAVISALRDNAAPLPIVIEFSRDNYDLLFSNGKETPVGHVKMGDGQFDKFSDKHRKHQLSMADSTLAFPEIIIEKPSQAKFGQITERPSSYIFVKTFLSTNNKDGVLFYNSITVKKDGLEVVITNYDTSEKRVKRDIKEGKLAYIKKVTLPSESGTSAQGDQSTIPAGDYSSVNKDNNTSG